MMYKKNRGFTLLELLVVIAIIGILSTIVLVSLQSARRRAQDAAIQAQLAQIPAAAELYRIDEGNYDGVCADSGVLNLLNSIGAEAGSVVCNDSATEYCASAPAVEAGGHFCVDSDGARVRFATGCGTGTSCPTE